MRAVVTGMIATYPVGGVAWDYGQYALGLERMGFEVYYLEDTGQAAYTYNPEIDDYEEDPADGLRFLRESLALLSPSLADRWHYRDRYGETHGIGAPEFAGIVAEADLFLNVSGGCMLQEEYRRCPNKVFVDTDPGWNHFVIFPRWDAKPRKEQKQGFRAHDHFFTYATRLGEPDCPLPDFGLAWHPTRPPVVPDLWNPRLPGRDWTTVMMWNNYEKPILYDGATYGAKEVEFVHTEDLPARSAASFEVAVQGAAPRERWKGLGWSVVDGRGLSETAEAYRAYVEGSRGEFSVAKNIYVATRSGWFSCRSVCYLAAGRPVVVQDTGFPERVPTGEGLFAFSGAEEAARAVAAVEGDYEHHSGAARELARERFESSVVLGEMLERIGVG